MTIPGLFIPIPIVLPNLIWVMAPKPPAKPERPDPATASRVLSMIEAGGRGAVLVVPLFLKAEVATRMDEVFLAVGGLALTIYYAGWMRYFAGGRSPALLFRKLAFLPVPLAVAPVVYFLAFSLLTRSMVLGAVSALFGCAHVYLSLKHHHADP